MNCKIARPVQLEINAWGLPRKSLLDLLNFLRIDLPTSPKKYLAEQVVPYADMFTCPFVLSAFPPFEHSLLIMFFVRIDKTDLNVVAVRFPDNEIFGS